MRSTHMRARGSHAYRLAAVFFILVLALPLAAQQLTLRHFAGPTFGSPDGPIGETYIGAGGANTMDRDAAGNFYFANGSTIRKLSAAGEVTTIAGLAASESWADGRGGNARFKGAIGLDRDDAGNLWIADTQNHVIRKITPDGQVTTVAGTAGLTGFVNGTGAAVRFNEPRGIAVDHTGVVYVSDYNNGSIRKIAPDGTVSTFATLSTVLGMDVDASNNLYAVDQFRVNRFTPAGVRTIIAGGSTRGFVDGTGSAAKFDVLRDIAVASDGSVMYVTDQWNGRVRKVTAAGVVTSVAGQGFGGPQLDGTGSAAKFSLAISGIVLDETTNILYVSDGGNIRVVTLPAGVVTTQGIIPFGYTNGPARDARFYELRGLAVDNAGNVYASDDNNRVIRKITPSGIVSTFAGNGSQASVDGPANTASFLFPKAMTTDGTNLYLLDSGYTIRKITPAGDVTTLAGAAWFSGSADGTGSAARFNSPNDLVYDPFSDCLFVADSGNYTVRKVTMAGVVTTLAGLPGVTGTQNGTGTGARFKGPSYIAADPNTGNLFVTEWGNYNIRKITQGGVVTSFSGSLSTDAHADGNATNARFKSPSGLTSDTAGNLYVVDFWGPTVRKVAPDGSVTTILGAPLVYEGWSEGTGTGARMSNPQRIATDRDGNFFIIDPNGTFIAIATPSIPDAASATPATAAIGVTRQLDAAPRNATSYRWEMVRRPANSNAVLSSPTLPDPIFTPDVIDRFIFRLYAEGNGSSSVSTIDVFATCDTDPPVISVTGGSDPSCTGSAVTLDAGSWSSYAWSNGATTRTITVAPVATTTYSVTVTDGNGCERPAASKTITVHPSLSSVAISVAGTTGVCPTATAGTFTAAVTGGGTSTIQWGYRTVSGGAVTDLAGRTGTSYTLAADDFAPGSYLLVATASAECGGPLTSNEIAVTVHAPVSTPAVSASGPTTFCEGGSVDLSAPAGYTYLWSNGATTQSIAVSAPGSYSVTVTDANGCSATSAATTVTVHTAPEATIAANGPTTFCIGGSVTLSAPAGYSYLWSTGATTDSIAVAEGGSYSVTVTNGNGCSATSAATAVIVHPLPAFGIHANQVYSFASRAPRSQSEENTHSYCGTDIAVRLTSTVLDPTWTYSWSTGASSASIVVNAGGTYTLTATTPNGCSHQESVTIVINTPPTVTISGPEAICPGGTATLTASAGASYLWSTGATTQSFAVDAAGSYSVTVTADNGCIGGATANVTLNQASLTADGPTSFCSGGSVTLNAGNGGTYLWSTGATTQSITVSQSGTYSVTQTFAEGCALTPDPIVVSVGPSNVSIGVDDNTVCPNAPMHFGSYVTGNPPNLTYQWTLDGVAIDGATSSTLTHATAQSGYGSIRLIVTDSVTGCSITSEPTTYFVYTQPAPVIEAGGPTTFCEGGGVTLTAPSGASSYLWSNGATTQAIWVTQPGSYSVTVTESSGCSGTSAPVTVTVDALPAQPAIGASGSTTFCEGGSVVLTSTPATSYLWSNGATTQSINVTQSGSYTVTVTNANGCSAVSAVITVNVNATPSATITPSGPTTFCEGGSVTLTAPAGLSYLWSTGATSQSINVTQSGSYSVTTSNASGCSTTSAATAVTVNANPSAAITPSGPTTFCEGGSVTLTASAASSYLWSNGATTQSINVTQSGSYTVTVTNANGCSAASAVTTVNVSANPSATITPSGPTTFCEGGSVTLTASAASSYLWSTGATTQSINVTQSGSYTVTVTNASGCSTSSSATTVTVNPLPAVPAITGPSSFCPSTTVTLTAPAGAASYLWSTGATTQSINVGTAGNYTVTVTNAQGCPRTSAPFPVTANAATQINTHPASATIARNTTRVLTVTASGTAPLQYQWYAGVSGTTSSPVAGATGSSYTAGPFNKKGTYRYWVRVTSGTCTGSVVDSNTATITVN